MVNFPNGSVVLFAGHKTHQLDRGTVDELQRAKTATEAEAIYNRLAPHVARCDRLAVWQRVDSVKL